MTLFKSDPFSVHFKEFNSKIYHHAAFNITFLQKQILQGFLISFIYLCVLLVQTK